ncbi:MAG TPA: FlgD immunoglobulin-like domain containing protein [Candidatus Eisenbacteria bacterium]|jgi:hypothetical protein
MSRPQGIPTRAAAFTLLTALVLATTAHAARPRFEDEALERPARPRPTIAMPEHWTLGQPVRFPRELLPLIMGEMEVPITEPAPEPASVLRSLIPAPESHRDATPFGANRLLNDPTGDPLPVTGIPSATQSENSLAAHGRFLASGWNDSFDLRTPRSFSGFGFSSDGGRTWHDGGTLPPAGADDQFFGDPSLTVDEDGNFYYASLYARPGITLGVSVSRGRFVNDVLVFDKPVLAGVPGTQDSFDKEWIVADPKDGTLYLSYTRFFDAGGDQIELVHSRDHGRTWSEPLVVTDIATESVQGSRPAVGPDHELFVVYSATDLTDFNSHMRIRRARSHGRNIGAFANIGEGNGDVSVYPNFVSGPPGFNRGNGVEFPSIAVSPEREHGRGDIFVTWNEAVDYFDDPLGGGGVLNETEGNGSPATANPITLGETVTGTLDSPTDVDWFSFAGHAGETVEFFLTPPQGASTGGFLRMFGPGGAVGDRLALSAFGGGVAFIVFTLPSDGTYFIRPALLNARSKLGPYLLFTGLHQPNVHDVATDSRDVMLSRSRDGIHWTRRERVNDDPARYDNAFAEVAVDGGGDVHVVWYDHRNDARGGILTDLFHARSHDGGRTFGRNERVNDGPGINWSLVPSQLAPNMGDYIALDADGRNVYAVWADGRLGTPDSWLMRVSTGRDDDDVIAAGPAETSAETPGAVEAAAGVRLALRLANPTRAGAPVAMTIDVPRTAESRLEIFSVTGQRVRTLLEGAMAVGTHSLTWDARGRDGAPVAPGLYFAVLRSGADVVRQRIVMVR